MSLIVVKGRRFIITNHARERFVERFSTESRNFVHLSRRCKNDCELCRELTFQLLDIVNQDKEKWDEIIYTKLRDAEDVKIFNNNARFMEYMYANYGYERFHFLVKSEILFVAIEEDGRNIVKTCVNANYPVNGSRVIADFIRRPRYHE